MLYWFDDLMLRLSSPSGLGGGKSDLNSDEVCWEERSWEKGELEKSRYQSGYESLSSDLEILGF